MTGTVRMEDGSGRVIGTRPAELSQQESNEVTLHDRARQAYTANRTYLNLATPTTAQNLTQIRSLTRQVQALWRLGPLRDLLADDTID